jgi:hypothetical protein
VKGRINARPLIVAAPLAGVLAFVAAMNLSQRSAAPPTSLVQALAAPVAAAPETVRVTFSQPKIRNGKHDGPVTLVITCKGKELARVTRQYTGRLADLSFSAIESPRCVEAHALIDGERAPFLMVTLDNGVICDEGGCRPVTSTAAVGIEELEANQ